MQFLNDHNSDKRNYGYNSENIYHGTITPQDQPQPNYEDEPPLYEDDYAQYPYTFNNYYYR